MFSGTRYGNMVTIFSLLAALSAPSIALSANSGIDTPPGVTDLPFGIEGTQIMDLTSTGLAIVTTGTEPPLQVAAGTNASRVAYFNGSVADYLIPLTLINANVACNSGGQWAFGLNGSTPSTFSAMPPGTFWIHEDCFGPRLVITAAGNVGIGTTAPIGNLDIESPASPGNATLCLNARCTNSLPNSLTVVSATSQSGSCCGNGSCTSVTVACPAGRHAISGGVYCSSNASCGGSYNTHMIGSMPTSLDASGQPTGWWGQCTDYRGYAPDSGTIAYAVCQ